MARDAFGQVDLVYGMAPNVEFKGSCKINSLDRRRRITGLQCSTRLMLKQRFRVS